MQNADALAESSFQHDLWERYDSKLVEFTKLADQYAHTSTVRAKRLPTLESVRATVRQERERMMLTREQLAVQSRVPVKVVDQLEDVGAADIEYAQPVFDTLHIEPFLLPTEFATIALGGTI
ncbi:hypothetical protein [Bifidobacterium oedipodis]|uniref:XRE family transcriptional regulator n=1 Tax=Bifidobacterium oedipodis TaxID=2675322 RepID=A0A7Y0ESN7_9BIFI|nr:hypothetical protein [Bifidobacterium sp. DSM 109957]NMM94616.1 hypothetical protein [Bifidobacterium sp. DSM 109957]